MRKVISIKYTNVIENQDIIAQRKNRCVHNKQVKDTQEIQRFAGTNNIKWKGKNNWEEELDTMQYSSGEVDTFGIEVLGL